jgi:drug/metabolite transporter (DMT)-like permease
VKNGRENATLVLLILIWGTTWAAIRIGLAGIPPITGVALRFTIAGLLLLLLCRWRGIPLGRTAVERRLWLLNAALSFCGSYGIVYWAEQTVPSGLTAVIFSTFPLFTLAFAHLLIPGDALRLGSLAGGVLALGGLVLVYSEDFAALGNGDVRRAAAILLISPAVSAYAAVAVKRWGKDVHPLSITAVPMLLAGVFMGGLALVVERGRTVRFDAVSIGALLYLAVIGSAVTFTLYYWLMGRMQVTRLSLIAFVIPVVALLLGALAFHEPVTWRIVAGSALVLSGVGVASLLPQRGKPAPGVAPAGD